MDHPDLTETMLAATGLPAEPETYRVKQPVRLQAMQLLGSEDGEAARAVARWCHGSVVGTYEDPHLDFGDPQTICVRVGEFVVQGVTGHFFKCTQAEFEATYERVQ